MSVHYDTDIRDSDFGILWKHDLLGKEYHFTAEEGVRSIISNIPNIRKPVTTYSYSSTCDKWVNDVDVAVLIEQSGRYIDIGVLIHS